MSAGLWDIFLVTFVLGLGGAISPGALLTYTIYKGIEAGPKAYRSGLLISFGHAVIEILIIFLLLLGASTLMTDIRVTKGIGIVGGLILIFFGTQIVRDWLKHRIDVSFLDSVSNPPGEIETGTEKRVSSAQIRRNPFIGGILFLMANPFWWLWWGTVGLGIIMEYGISYATPVLLLVFIVGKELGQILWYTFISVVVGYSRKIMTPKAYLAILLGCAAFMIGFGIYLPIKAFLS
jgi:threonine/homoserine/homoserine lactone efflux protein